MEMCALKLVAIVDRHLLILSTIFFFAAVVRSVIALRARLFRRSRFNFVMIALGFALQTMFLSVRGHALGRCPITNLFEVLVFLAWSIALIYMLVGPAYRLSLMGVFTAPLVLLLQLIALLAPIDTPHTARVMPTPWLEFHASISIIAYGVIALHRVGRAVHLLKEERLR